MRWLSFVSLDGSAVLNLMSCPLVGSLQVRFRGCMIILSWVCPLSHCDSRSDQWLIRLCKSIFLSYVEVPCTAKLWKKNQVGTDIFRHTPFIFILAYFFNSDYKRTAFVWAEVVCIRIYNLDNANQKEPNYMEFSSNIPCFCNRRWYNISTYVHAIYNNFVYISRSTVKDEGFYPSFGIVRRLYLACVRNRTARLKMVKLSTCEV